MKLKAVEKLCKKRGVVCLFDEPAVVEYIEDEEIQSTPHQWMGGGVPYVAVKSGCILRGLIWPYKAVDEQFVEVLGEIYNAAAVSLAASKEEQMEMEV